MVFSQVLGRPATTADEAAWEGWLGTAGNSLAMMRAAFPNFPEAQARIADIYQAVLGRPVDAAGLAAWGAVLAGGGSLAQVRMDIAQSPESTSDIAALYQALLGRAPSADETAGMQAALGVALTGTPTFTLTGTVNGAAQTFATANAATQLTELAVYVTLNSGVTPTLTDPFGTVTSFPDATQLAAYLLGAALQTGGATPVLLSTYNLTINWLAQTNQWYLQAGERELIAARAAQASGNSPWQQEHEVTAQVFFDTAAAGWNSNFGQAANFAGQAWSALNAGGQYAANYAAFYETAERVYLALGLLPPGQQPDTLLTAARNFLAGGFPNNPANTVDATNIANAEADAALQNEALAPAARHAITERLTSTQASTTTIDVTVDQNAYATVHSKDQSASPVLGIVTAVVDLATIIPPLQPVAVPLAIGLNAGQAVNDFAHGDTISGLIHAGSAVGFGYVDPNIGANTVLAGKIFSAVAVVAGTNSVVQSAQGGSALGVIAGALEVSAGIAGGLISFNQIDAASLQTVQSITVGLGIAAGATAGAAAIEKGDIANGLLAGLGAVYGGISAFTASNNLHSGSNDVYAALDTRTRTDAAPDIVVTGARPQLPGYATILSILPALGPAHDARVQYIAQHAPSANNPAVDPQHATKPTIPAGDKVIFVGGLNDGSSHIVYDAYKAYIAVHPGQAMYFSWDQEGDIQGYITQNSGHVSGIGHSWGADTLATLVSHGLKLNTLVTLDPVSLFTPSFSKVAANCGSWYDYDAVGPDMGSGVSNSVAGVGGSWDTGPAQNATVFQKVNLSHGDIGGRQFVSYLLGVPQ